MVRYATILSMGLGSLLLSGCWLSENEVQDRIDDISDSDLPGEIAVASVEPAWGTDAGGTEVVVTASPVGAGAIVRFDDANGAVLTVDADGGTILVETPAGTPGTADVSVQWGAKAGLSEDAYRYFADGSGEYGAIGSISWYDYVGLLASLGYVDSGFAWVNLVEPSPYSHAQFYGASLDMCQSNWSFPGTIDEISDASQVRLSQEEGTGLVLTWNRTSKAFEAEVTSAGGGGNAWVSYAVFDLDPLVGTTNFPSISAKGFARTAGKFDVSAGDSVSQDPLDDFSPPTVLQTDFQLRWDTTNAADYIVLRLRLWGDSEASGPTEEVRCLLADDGSFEVPATVWTTSPDSISVVDIWMGRATASTALLPHDASASGVAGVYWVIGTAAFFAF